MQDYHRKIILYGLLIIITIVLLRFNTSLNWATCVSLLSFISFIFIIYESIDYENDYYTPTRLFLTVIIYSCIMVGIYWGLSWYIDGDTYIFSKKDAWLYERVSNIMKDMPFTDSLSYMRKHHSYDDWGVLVMISSILRIIPSKIFLNFCYVIMGGLTAFFMFKTGCRVMSRQYAYLAALSYTISSYNIFFYGSYLKETGFILLIVLLFNSLYKYIIEEHKLSLVYIIIYSILICFFRPAVTVFIWFGIFVYYLFRSGSSIIKITAVSIICIVVLLLSSKLQSIFYFYTLEGDIDLLLKTKGDPLLSRSADYIINFFASLFGPFPTLIGTDKPRSCLYGPGLLYKFFMNLPFWLAVWKIVKNKIVDLYPMIFFILIEAISAAIVQRGFELRITLPHIAMYFMLVFWYFSETDSDDEKLFNKYSPAFFIISFLIVCGWGILR